MLELPGRRNWPDKHIAEQPEYEHAKLSENGDKVIEIHRKQRNGTAICMSKQNEKCAAQQIRETCE